MKEIKALPAYLQPKILSAVAYVNSASPDLDKAIERNNVGYVAFNFRKTFGYCKR